MKSEHVKKRIEDLKIILSGFEKEKEAAFLANDNIAHSVASSNVSYYRGKVESFELLLPTIEEQEHEILRLQELRFALIDFIERKC